MIGKIQTWAANHLGGLFHAIIKLMELKSLGKFFKIWYPALVMAIVIFIFSSMPALDSNRQSGLIVNAITFLFPDLKNTTFLVTIVRKSAHFLEYALLGFLTARAFRLSKKSSWWSVLACAAYAGTDEFHQSFIPGRSAEPKDIALDTIGATFGVLVYWLFTRKKK